MVFKKTVYEIAVEGQLHGLVTDDNIHVYKVEKAPGTVLTHEEAMKIIDDFEVIRKMEVAEITTVTTKKIVHLR